MASSTHQQQARYPPVPHQNSRDEDLRLPSIKDLNFHHYSRRQPQDASQISPADHQDNATRNVPSWPRPNQSQSPMHPYQQQHTPPLSAGHDTSPPKLDNGGFLTPGMPLSAQSTPVPGSITIGPGARNEDAHHPKRQRRTSDTVNPPRDGRSPHVSLILCPSSHSIEYFLIPDDLLVSLWILPPTTTTSATPESVSSNADLRTSSRASRPPSCTTSRSHPTGPSIRTSRLRRISTLSAD